MTRKLAKASKIYNKIERITNIQKIKIAKRAIRQKTKINKFSEVLSKLAKTNKLNENLLKLTVSKYHTFGINDDFFLSNKNIILS